MVSQLCGLAIIQQQAAHRFHHKPYNIAILQQKTSSRFCSIAARVTRSIIKLNLQVTAI
jgi:Holliday junction resolvasome RuvABC endonuclease subunit